MQTKYKANAQYPSSAKNGYIVGSVLDFLSNNNLTKKDALNIAHTVTSAYNFSVFEQYGLKFDKIIGNGTIQLASIKNPKNKYNIYASGALRSQYPLSWFGEQVNKQQKYPKSDPYSQTTIKSDPSLFNTKCDSTMNPSVWLLHRYIIALDCLLNKAKQNKLKYTC